MLKFSCMKKIWISAVLVAGIPFMAGAQSAALSRTNAKKTMTVTHQNPPMTEADKKGTPTPQNTDGRDSSALKNGATKDNKKQSTKKK